MRGEKQHNRAEILAKTIPLFAAAGYAGVSMRQIAQTVGIKAASLYHYFPDKQSLYIAALSQAFSRHADFMSESFTLSVSPEMRLYHLVKKLCILVEDDEDFRKLLHREMLDGDEKRLQLLADYVFGDFFRDMIKLCHSLSPNRDPHLLTVSILSMVIHHYQITPMRSFLPGFKTTHNDPQVLAEHISSLLKIDCRRSGRRLDTQAKLEVETVMLDLDGTIIDSVGIYYEIVKVTLREMGLPEVSTAQIRQANQNGRFLWEKLFPADMFGEQAHLQDEAWAIARRISPEMFKQRVTLLPGAADSLRKVVACGFKLAVVTSTPRQNMPAKLAPLKAAGVFDLLQEIITADDTERKKPSADPLLECCRRLAADPGKAVYVGDTLIDIQAGKAAGTGTIGVLTGFDTRAMLQEEKPDAIILSLAELVEVVRLK